MKLLFLKYISIFFFHILFSPLIFQNNLHASFDVTQTCSNLIISLEVNTGAYKNCLYQKAGEKFTREELNKCKKYYLQETERLSYVYKNICK